MGSPVILLRGLFRSRFHWGDFPHMLQDICPDRPVFCLDIPGAGEQYQALSPCSVTGMVESLRAGFSHRERADIIAVSMGGMIGLKWAELYPDEISSVVCVNTSAAGFSPFWQRLRPANYFQLLKILCFKDLYQREASVYRLVSNQPPDFGLIERWAEAGEKYPMRRVNFFRQLYAASRFQVSQPACRLLFVSSSQDHLVSPEATRAIARAWNESLMINEKDGHDIPLDNPSWLCDQINHWFSVLNQSGK